METKKTTKPAFFKFFYPDTCQEQLAIPSAFTLSMKGSLPDNVALRDRYNNLWQVKIAKVGDKLYFNDGWKNFIEDNSIKAGDVIIFEYSCDGLFDIKFLGPSACEKPGVIAVRISREEKKKMVKEEDKVDENEETNEEMESDDSDYVLDSEVNDDDDWEDEIITDDHALKRKEETSTGGTERKSRGKRRVPDIYGTQIFRSGLVHRPNNRFFLTKINPKRKHELYIPMDIVSDQSLKLPEEIMMVDPNRRRWISKRKKWNDGRTYYSGGWRKLCQANFVQPDDTCMCELVERSEGVSMHVSFIHANPAN